MFVFNCCDKIPEITPKQEVDFGSQFQRVCSAAHQPHCFGACGSSTSLLELMVEEVAHLMAVRK